MAAFAGTWKMESNENLDKLLEAVGAPEQMRAHAVSARPVLTVTVNGNHYMFKQEVIEAGKAMTTEFDLGVEFDEKYPDGRQAKSTVNKVGEKLVQVQKGQHTINIERWVQGNELTITAECNGVKSIAKYKRTA